MVGKRVVGKRGASRDDDDDEIGGGGLLLSDLGRCSSEAITANPGCNPSLSVDIV